MYRIPQKNQWYRQIAYHRPRYRYSLLIVITGIFLIGWRYGLYIWFNAAIMHEQATILQLQQRLLEQATMERQIEELKKQLPLLKNVCVDGARSAIGMQSCDQCSYIFNEVHCAGLHVTGYQTSAAKKQHTWKSSQFITICLQGTLDQMETFLLSLKKSARLVQCTSLSLQHDANTKYIFECTIQFIFPQLH